jgi:hypothetical protein
VHPHGRSALRDAIEEAALHRPDVLLVPQTLLRKHAQPEQSLVVGVLTAAASGITDAFRLLMGGGSGGGAGAAAASAADGSSASTTAEAASVAAKAAAITAGTAVADAGAAREDEALGNAVAMAREAESAPIVRALLTERAPCIVGALFDYGGIGSDASLFSLEANWGCCTANFVQGWPKYIQRLVPATPGGGAAVSMYAPATARLAGGFALEVAGDFPFDDVVNITVTAPGGGGGCQARRGREQSPVWDSANHRIREPTPRRGCRIRARTAANLLGSHSSS